MKDIYVNVPADAGYALVPQALQPDYPEQKGIDGSLGLSMGDALLRRGLSTEPNRVAAIHAESGRAYTFAFIEEQSTRLALQLVAGGLKTGDRIGLRSRNVPEALVAICAIWKSGGVLVPIPYSAAVNEIIYFSEDTGLRVLLVDEADRLSAEDQATLTKSGIQTHEFLDAVKRGTASATLPQVPSATVSQLPTICGDQLAIIWHTGGTTGRPKGCYHTHRRFYSAGQSFGASAEVQPGERWAASAPIGHALGFIHHTIFTVMHGAVAVFIEDYAKPEAILRALDYCKVEVFTGMMLTWAKLDKLIAGDERGKSPKYLRHGYAMWQTASADDVRRRWADRGVVLNNNYGSTSFATWVILPRRGDAGPPSCLGKPAEGYAVQCVDVDGSNVTALPRNSIGRLAVKGPTGLTYWNRPELQARDIVQGWTICDDLIRVDEGGFIHYLGRSDFMISSAGHKIAPVEVEAVVSKFRLVKEVAVVPAPCRTRYEQVVAFIVPEAAASEVDFIAELDSFVKSKLPFYKVPKIYRIVDDLPKDSVGKIRTKVIREWAVQLVA